MDEFTDMLHHLRSSGALVGRTLADPPWSTRFAEHASLTLVTMLRGQAWAVVDGDSHRIGPHDIAVIVGPAPFEVVSSPEVRGPHLYVQTEAGVCFGQDGRASDDIGLGARSCGTQVDADDLMLTGSFAPVGRIADRLVGALPRILVVPRSARQTAVLELLEEEAVRDGPAQQAILDRLLDLILVGTLRDWFAMSDSSAPGWYRASFDPVVGAALSAMHDSPNRPWTVAQLAREARVSRATLARKFTELVGEPPMSYLAGWRLCMAADLLERSDVTVETVAKEVGYSSAYALSAAFVREFGQRPSQYRQSRSA